MTLRLRDLRVPLELEGRPPSEIAAHRLGVPVEAARIVRKSLDARAGREPFFVYTLEVELDASVEARLLRGGRRGRIERVVARGAEGDDEDAFTLAAGGEGTAASRGDAAAAPARDAAAAARGDAPPREPPFARIPLRAPPVIVGSGPAGMFAAWRLVRDGFRPLLLERGPDATTRGRRWGEFLRGGPFDPECNLLFGEGGAGTFSDGKLTTRIKDPRVAIVLRVLVEHGAPEACLWLAKPHVGSNALPAIVRRLRRALVAAGARVRFGTRVDDLLVREGRVDGVRCGDERIDAGCVVLAIGHSARDMLRALLAHGVAAEPKPFQIGLRIEHPQTLVDRWQYGAACGHPALPVAEYALVSRDPHGRRADVHSFCMCPGGEILPATERAGFLCVNGASPKARDGRFANSGLVVTVEPDAFGATPQGGIALQERLEARAFALGGGDFGAPGQRVADFLAGRAGERVGPTSYPFAVRPAPLAEVLPPGAPEALAAALREIDRRMPGYAGEDAMLVGPESRSSAPLRLLRDDATLESPSHAGLYPAGEGAGWAGGIVSAAVDGLRVAEAIARRYVPV